MPSNGIAARLLELGEELRSEGVAVGTSELLDAFAVLREIEWTSQQDFREALAATLAKSQDDRRIFELVFERFFFRAVELAAVREGVREDFAAHELRDGDAGELDLEELSEMQLDALRRQIAAALRDGDDGAMRDLARMAIAALARRDGGSGVIGVDVQRIRRALGLRAEPQPELPEDDPRREGLPRAALRRFEAMLRRELERAQVQRTGTLPPRARWGSLIARCPPARWRTLPRCTAWWRSCAGAWPRRAIKPAGTATTRTWTCAARCAPRCRPAACRSCSSTARAARGGRRCTCCATSPPA